VKQRPPHHDGDRERPRPLRALVRLLRAIAMVLLWPPRAIITAVLWVVRGLGRLLRAVGRALATPPRWVGSRVAGLAAAAGRSVRPTAGSMARAVAAPMSVDADLPESGTGGRDWFLLLDIVTAVVLYVLAAVWLVNASEAVDDLYPPQVMHLLALAGTLPVALRRSRPLLAWQLVLVAIVATSGWFTPGISYATNGHGGTLTPVLVTAQAVAYVLCQYTLASRTTRSIAVGSWLWSLIGLVIMAAAGMSSGLANAAQWGWSFVIVALVPLFGSNVRTRRRVQADLELQQRRNEQEQAARATLEERSRIARELHDVVAHNMSVIAIQAEAAPLKAPGDAGALETELASIRATALQTLTEMRRVLGVLRNRDDQVDTAPAPDVDQLEALVGRVRATGMDVQLTVGGLARPVPPGVGVSVYRIVQESLSNALRHAPGAAVRIALMYRDAPPAVHVRVENDPPPAAPPPDEGTGARHGLVGMRERATMLHGTLTAEPTPDGGFVVEATLPLEE
jgi:signal transduction histidine kinase